MQVKTKAMHCIIDVHSTSPQQQEPFAAASATEEVPLVLLVSVS